MKGFRNINTSDLVSLGVEILIAVSDILSLKLNDFTDPGSGSGHETDNKVIEVFLISQKTVFQVLVVCLADYVFKVVPLLYFYHGELLRFGPCKLQIRIQCPNTQVDCLRLIVFQKKNFIKVKVGKVNLAITT